VFFIVTENKGLSVCIVKVFAALTTGCDNRRMTSRISHTTIDCEDAYALSNWWKKVLKYVDDPEDPNLPGHQECLILPKGEGPKLLFIEVPEGKSGKNRLHFDLRPTDRTRDEEFDRLLKLGAKYVADHRGIHGPGTGWIVLHDPEGNEFCILRSDAEVEAAIAAGLS